MNIALFYGGRSGEHTVSLRSAQGVYQPLLNLGHTVYLVAITVEGTWYLQTPKTEGDIPLPIQEDTPLTIVAGKGLFTQGNPIHIDAGFAVTHGFGGEDGNLQGLCLLANIPLCGCDTLSSALAMHKEHATQLFAYHGIPTVPFHIVTPRDIQWLEGHIEQPPSWLQGEKRESKDRWLSALTALQASLGQSLFIKPEDSGSSLGVAALRTSDANLLRLAVLEASLHSAKVMIQSLIEPLEELECALLEQEDGSLFVAGPALVVDPGKQDNHFLSYAYKYTQVDAAYLTIDSPLAARFSEPIQTYAKKAFRAIGGEGYARVDFFLSEEKLYLNELNTSPGMTEKSHYPALMAHAGYTMEQVLETLLEHALRRKRSEQQRIYTPPES